MKKLTALVLTLMISGIALAWEKPNNPDKYPSVGLNYTKWDWEGNLKFNGSFFDLNQDVDTEVTDILLDVRLPLHDSFTLNIGYGITESEQKAETTGLLLGSDIDSDGNIIQIGGRFYFN